jgi:predicted nucleic acid-binding protein
MYVLDTNVLSELRRPDRAHRSVLAWASARPASEFFLSAITLLEIEWGALMRARQDPAAGVLLRRWIDEQVLAQFTDRILAVDAAVARRCAHLQELPNRRGERDALIAATALTHGMAVVTRNVNDFVPTGVAVIDPWSTA